MIGVFYLFGYGGTLLGTTPFAGLLPIFSWQQILFGGSGFTLLLMVLLAGLAACSPKAPAKPASDPTVPIISYQPHTCPTEDPYVGMSKEEFYADYTPACCDQDAHYRSKHGFLSGSLTVPGQYAEEATFRPTEGGSFVRNTAQLYLDENTYVVVDAYGNEAFRVYRGGGYITLEEVAAYVYAFGDVPANYVDGKSTEPENSIWGEYLRLNNTYFSGDTTRTFSPTPTTFSATAFSVWSPVQLSCTCR